jgi:hypothetical protein
MNGMPRRYATFPYSGTVQHQYKQRAHISIQHQGSFDSLDLYSGICASPVVGTHGIGLCNEAHGLGSQWARPQEREASGL